MDSDTKILCLDGVVRLRHTDYVPGSPTALLYMFTSGSEGGDCIVLSRSDAVALAGALTAIANEVIRGQ